MEKELILIKNLIYSKIFTGKQYINGNFYVHKYNYLNTKKKLFIIKY